MKIIYKDGTEKKYEEITEKDAYIIGGLAKGVIVITSFKTCKYFREVESNFLEWKGNHLEELQSEFCGNNDNFNDWCLEVWREVGEDK